MSIAASALTELRKSVGKAYPLLILTLPSDSGGTTRMSYVDVSVVATGVYQGSYTGKVKSWGDIEYKVSDREGNLQAVETSVSIDDTGTRTVPVGSFGRAIKLGDCQGSAAQIVLGIDGLDSDDFPVLFTGILDRWERDGTTGWRLYLRIKDEALRRPANRVKVGQAEWPAAHADALGKYVPLAMGTTSSEGLGDAGLRTALYVDTGRYRYLHTIGTASTSNFNVYSSGTLQTSGTDYTRSVVEVKGRYYTVVDFVADQEDGVVTIDSEGISLGSYGTSTNPANQLRFFLENCVFRDFNGADIATATYTDATAFTSLATYLTSFEGAPDIGGGDPKDGMTYLREFCQSFSVVCYWKEDGTLAVSPWTPFTTSIYPTSTKVFYGDHMTGDMGLMTSSDELIKAMTMRYLVGPDHSPTQSISVWLPSLLSAATKDRVATFGPGRVI